MMSLYQYIIMLLTSSLVVIKGNNKITELRTILQMESQNIQLTTVKSNKKCMLRWCLMPLSTIFQLYRGSVC